MPRKVVEVCVVTTLANDLGLIPPARLGPMLMQARMARSIGVSDLAQQLSAEFSPQEIRLLESGRLAATDTQLRSIFGVLGIEIDELIPTRVRLEIDRSQGRLVAGSSVTRVLPNATDAELLARYLSIIYSLRRVRPGTFLVPRTDDLEVFAEAFDQTAANVRLQLEHLMRHERDHLRLGVRALAGRAVLPGLGLFVGMTAIGALLLVEAQPVSAQPVSAQPFSTQSFSTHTVAKHSQAKSRVQIGTALVIERTPDRVAGFDTGSLDSGGLDSGLDAGGFDAGSFDARLGDDASVEQTRVDRTRDDGPDRRVVVSMKRRVPVAVAAPASDH
jgi:transcriptional regulator with XRE-family HTH domain